MPERVQFGTGDWIIVGEVGPPATVWLTRRGEGNAPDLVAQLGVNEATVLGVYLGRAASVAAGEHSDVTTPPET